MNQYEDLAKYLVPSPQNEPQLIQDIQQPIQNTQQPIQNVQQNIPTQNINYDDLAKYRIPQQEQKFQPEEEQEESLANSIFRNIERVKQRGAETALGLPGDIAEIIKRSGPELGQMAKKFLPEKFGSELEKASKFNERFEEKYGKTPRLPTSEQLKKISSKVSKEYEPQGEAEQFLDDVVQDFVGAALPVKGKVPFVRAIGTALGSNIASELTGFFGGGEKDKLYSKLGSSMILGPILGSKANKYIAQKGAELEKMIPKNATAHIPNAEKSIQEYIKELNKGDLTGSKAKALVSAERFASKIKDGKIPVDELIGFNKDINERLKELKFFDIGKEAIADKKLAIHRLKSVKNIINQGIHEYGKTNPELLNAYKDFNETFAAMEKSKKVTDFIKKVVTNPKKIYPITGSLSAVSYLFPGVIPFGIGAATTGALGTPPGQLLYRVYKSPKLRNYYIGVIKDATEQNAPGVLKNLKRLDDELKKDSEE